MSTMLYKYNDKGETIVQIDSPTDYHRFDAIVTDSVTSELLNGYFLTAKEALLAIQKPIEIEVVAENATPEVKEFKRGRPRK